MKLDIEPRAALDALARHIDQQRADLIDARDRRAEELDHARAEAHILREKLGEAKTAVEEAHDAVCDADQVRQDLTKSLREANDARAVLLDALVAARGEHVEATLAEELDTYPDGSTVLDRHGVMWQRWTTPGRNTRWWAHAPTLASPGAGIWSEGSGRWSSAALLDQRGPVWVIHIAIEGGQS